MTKLLALLLLFAGFTSAAAATNHDSAAQAAGAGGGAPQGFSSSVAAENGMLELRYHGQKLLVYAFASNQFKPYVRELYTTRGDNILLDAPPDHLHHHGLMYAIRVNGVNFWEERDRPGYEKPVRLSPVQYARSPEGLPHASFTQRIHWVSATNHTVADTAPVAMLIEQRTLTVTVDESKDEVALDWQADFEVGPGASKATLTGSSYHGLGFRLPLAFNLTAQHHNSENAPYPTQGTGDVIPARWSCVSHQVGDHAVSVALFGQRSPDRGLPVFFTMVRPFTYASATQGLDKNPIEHVAGDKFSLRYLLVAYAHSPTDAALEGRYQRWTESIGARPSIHSR